MHHYVFAGYRVASDIALAGLSEGGEAASDTVLHVRVAPVPPSLDSPNARGPNWAIAQDRLLLVIPSIVRLLLQSGCDLAVEVEGGLAPEAAAPFVVEPGLGLLLQQRGEVLLHAAAVSMAGQAILLCGGSGAGKSTLAAAFHAAGYPLVSDDLCLIRRGADGGWLVIPDGRRSALWADAAEALSQPLGPPLRQGIHKYHLGTGGMSDPQALPIGAIYRLREMRAASGWSIEPLRGVEALRTLMDHTYRPQLVRALGFAPSLLSHFASIAQHCRSFVLERPADLSELRAGVAAVEAHWAGEASRGRRR